MGPACEQGLPLWPLHSLRERGRRGSGRAPGPAYLSLQGASQAVTGTSRLWAQTHVFKQTCRRTRDAFKTSHLRETSHSLPLARALAEP